VNYFGRIEDGKMVLNDLGKYCTEEIMKTEKLRPYVTIFEFVVMPNHVHILMCVGERIQNNECNHEYVGTGGSLSETGGILSETKRQCETMHTTNWIIHNNILNQWPLPWSNLYQWFSDRLPPVPTARGMQSSVPVGWKIQSLGSIVWNIKSSVTKYANQNHIPFARQPRYHDHIVRNEKWYEYIKYYIQTNPEKRNTDQLNYA
jgi:putative transposase